LQLVRLVSGQAFRHLLGVLEAHGKMEPVKNGQAWSFVR
jgi:hypothetical protein